MERSYEGEIPRKISLVKYYLNNITFLYRVVYKKRETNKNMSIREQLQMEGRNLDDLQMKEELKQLRGDFGIKKSDVEQ